MRPPLPDQDLDCPHPAGCPVAVDQLTALAAHAPDALPRTRVSTRVAWHRVYHAHDGFDTANPGYGDSRFGPFDDTHGHRVPILYLAETLEAALLETTLHDVGLTTPRVVAEMTLLGLFHARITPPRPLVMVDLRDDQLPGLDLDRSQIASSTEEHYPCTRRIARALHAARFTRGPADGIVWHSRQAELTGRPAQEVAVVFADRVPTGRGTWELVAARSGAGALLEGDGRRQFDELAETLGITVMTSPDLEG